MSSLLEYFVRHKTAPNLALLMGLLMGALCLNQLNVQLSPDFIVNRISVEMKWRGASSKAMDVEIARPLTLALAAMSNTDRVRTTSFPGRVYCEISFLAGTDMQAALAGVQSAVANIASLPAEVDQPRIRLHTPSESVSQLIVSGDFSDRTGAALSADILDRLRASGIGNVRLAGNPNTQYFVNVDPLLARENSITLNGIATSIRHSLAATSTGTQRFGDGQSSVRVDAMNELKALETVTASIENDGVLVGDIAQVKKTKSTRGVEAYFPAGNGFSINIRRNPGENVLEISNRLNQVVQEVREDLPATVSLTQYAVRADNIRKRLGLLIKNGVVGLSLVALILFLFLSFRAAFWVCIGIPSAFAFTFILMWVSGQSINFISAFTMIMILGIIVDDAIVVAESISSRQTTGSDSYQAAIDGASVMLKPVTTAMLTTIAAFAPIALLTDAFGSYVKAIPLFVCVALLASFFECFLLLPGHMRGSSLGSNQGRSRLRTRIDGLNEKVAVYVSKIVVSGSYRYRYAALLIVIAIIGYAVALVQFKEVKFRFWLNPASNYIFANLTMIPGASRTDTKAAIDHYWTGLRAAELSLGYTPGKLVKATYAITGRHFSRATQQPSENLAGILVELVDNDGDRLTTKAFSSLWRKSVSAFPNLQTAEILEQRSGPDGADVHVAIQGANFDDVRSAVDHLERALGNVEGVVNIGNTIDSSQNGMVYELNPTGVALGLTGQMLGQQLFDATSGILADRVINDDQIADVIVRYRSHNHPEATLSYVPIATGNGSVVSLPDVATLSTDQVEGRLTREDGYLSATVKASIDDLTLDVGLLWGQLDVEILPQVQAAVPGVRFNQEGKRQDQKRALSEIGVSLIIALVAIYIILAWSMSSFWIPIGVMLVLPLGAAGTVIGHHVMGYALTTISLVAMLALLGILVNDTIILFNEIVKRTEAGATYRDAVVDAFTVRFRAVLLTTLTTVAGLIPLISESSFQAQFLIPIAISIAWGLSIGTMASFIVVPCLVSIAQDIKWILTKQSGSTPNS